MTDPHSPSTSYKGSLDLEPVGSTHEADQELTLVNPCYAAPTPFTELQPFSSRQSQNRVDQNPEGRGERTRPTIPEDGEKGVHMDGGVGDEIEMSRERTLSKTKMFLTAAGMCLTYFLGVSFLSTNSFFVGPILIRQTASSASVTLMIPDIARSLQVSELSAQWVVSAYSLAYGW